MTTQGSNKGLNIFIILWAAILWSCVIFLGLATFQIGGPFFSVESFLQESPMSFIYYSLALILFVSAFKVPSLLMRGFQIDPSSPMEDLEKKYFVPFVIKIVMFETCTLFGFVLSITTQKNLVLPFFLLSLVGFLMNIPSRGKIRTELMRGGRRI